MTSYIILGLLPIFFYVLMGKIFKGYHHWMIPCTLSMIFIESALLNKIKKMSVYRVSLIISPLFIMFFAVSLFSGFTFTFTYLVFIPVSIYLGIIFAKRKSYWILAGAIPFFVLAGFVIFPNWLVWSDDFNAYKNTTYKNIDFIDQNEEEFVLDQSKINVLDFWTMSCGVCFKKFPEYEKYYLKYKDNPEVALYTVNVPVRDDNNISEVQEMVKKLGYRFPTLFVKSRSEILDLNIDAYPQLVIIKDGKVRYNGRLEMDDWIFVHHLEDEIDRLINE